MGEAHARYDYGAKVAAASAVVDGGTGKPEAMRRFGIASLSPLRRWRRLCREGGAEALGPKPRGRPRGPGRGAAPRTREQELGERAQARGPGGAPEKIDSPEGGAALPNRERALAAAGLSGRGRKPSDLLECAGLAGSSHHCALAHPRRPTRPGLRGRVAGIFGRLPDGVGRRQIAMGLRAVDAERIADKTVLKMMGEMGLRCGIRKESGHHRCSSYTGEVGETSGNVIGRDFGADGPRGKTGTDVTEFKPSFGEARLAPVYGFGSREIAAWSIPEHPGLAQQEEMLAMLVAAKPEGREPILHSDMGWQQPARSVRQGARGERLHPEHVAQGRLHRQRGHRAGLRPLEGRVLPRAGLGGFESFKRDLEACIHHWSHTRRQVKLKGLTPVEFREQALREAA